MTAAPRAVVGVAPSAEFSKRATLFAALERAFPVSFTFADGAVTRGLDGFVSLASGSSAGGVGVPTLVFSGLENGGRRGRIEFGDVDAVPSSFRGKTLVDEQFRGFHPIAVEDGDVVLASCEGAPCWVATRNGAKAAPAPLDLGNGVALRDRLRPGRFAALLPLVEFLRTVTAGIAWAPPPLRASFVIDDPNLHFTRYGHIRYRELVSDAEAHNYHVAMAMVPLDAWFANARARRIFSQCRHRLSLIVHGNDHVRRELDTERTGAGIDAILAQALQRVQRFERRTGLRVARVMAPPHGACSNRALEGLDRVGFDAICWSGADSVIAPGCEGGALARWGAGGFAAGALSALPRLHLGSDHDDIPFRVYLNQPLILYGHHQDLARGPGVLADVAARVAPKSVVRWTDLDDIVDTRHEVKVDGTTLCVRLLARRGRIVVPPGATAVEISFHDSLQLAPGDAISCRAGGMEQFVAIGGDGRARLDVNGGATVCVRLTRPSTIDPDAIVPPRSRAWPLIRRLATEARDQMAPIVQRGHAPH